jgi:putative ABC transport system permease protein
LIAPADATPTARAVLVNETMARLHWPGVSPIGQRVTVDDVDEQPEWFTVVGVVRDSKQDAWSAPTEPELYFPQLDAPAGDRVNGREPVEYLNPTSMTLVVRGASDPRALVPAIERAVAAMEPDAPVSGIVTMEEAIGRQVAQPRFYVVLLGVFAAVALVLAAVGVYGVISYAVTRRTREIGIRLALGADRADPFRLVVGNGMRLAAVGGAIGLVGAFWVTRYLHSLLYGVGPTDPATFVLVPLVLGAVALAACCIPAWRASRTDPVVALRGQ